MSAEALKSFFDWGTVVLVGLTFIFGAGALITGNKISKRQDKELADFKLKAANAERAAGEANQNAGEASERAKNLENANLTLRGQIATLETGASQQKERAANAEKELIQLKQKLKWRTITPEQRAELIRLLSPVPKNGTTVLSVSSGMGDAESDAFGNQIADVLKASGFTVSRGSAVWTGGNPIGFRMAIHSAEAVPVYAAPIQRAFDKAGLPLDGMEKADVKEGEIQIIVGIKPQ